MSRCWIYARAYRECVHRKWASLNYSTESGNPEDADVV